MLLLLALSWAIACDVHTLEFISVLYMLLIAKFTELEFGCACETKTLIQLSMRGKHIRAEVELKHANRSY